MKNSDMTRWVLAALLFFASAVQAQSMPPKWISGGLTDLRHSYVEVVSGDASTIDAAQDKAALEIVQRRNLTADARLNVHVVNGKITTTGDREIVVSARILDKYTERLSHGGWRVYLLVQTLKNAQYDYEPVSVTDEYPLSARCFVPGMQQLYKGHQAKGLLFIAGEAVCVGGIILAENMRVNNANLIGSSHDAKQKATYTDRANTWTDVRSGCIAAAAAVYVWNVVDALVSKGARRVSTREVALIPYTNTQTFGLAMKLNF